MLNAIFGSELFELIVAEAEVVVGAVIRLIIILVGINGGQARTGRLSVTLSAAQTTTHPIDARNE